MKNSTMIFVRIVLFAILGAIFIGGVVLYSHTHELKSDSWKDNASSIINDSDDKTKKYEKTFSVTSGGKIDIDADAGEIEIETWDKNEAYVFVEISGSDRRLEKYEVDFKQEGNTVKITGKVRDNSFFKWHVGNLEAHYTIKVPKKFNVSSITSGGDIHAKNISGETILKTSGGSVYASSIEGELDAETSGGNVEVSEVKGNVSAQTSGGNVLCEKITGDVRSSTSGGNAECIAIDGRVKAKTSGGDVRVKLNGENKGVDARTSGGDIVIYVNENIKADIDAETSGGSVDCDLPVTVKGKIERSELHGKINGGGNPIKAETSGGDIKIALIK